MTIPLRSYPTGVRALLVAETARRKRVETRFVDVLARAGFDEIVLPMIDFVEPYVSLVDRTAAKQSYRFVDRDGELVAIRSDFTPMVARALAPALTAAELPLRVFYRGDVIRCEASRLGLNRELFQIGAEIIGDGSVEADREALLLATDVLAQFGIRPLVVYNDVSIVESLIASARRTATDPIAGEQAIRTALLAKRTTALATIANEIPASTFALIAKLAAGDATLDDFRACELTEPAAARLAAIEQVTAKMRSADFILHLDDIDESPGYYTGLRFRIYDGATRTRLAQGGRYDSLYGRFGSSAAAIGFTFTIDDLDVSALPTAAREIVSRTAESEVLQ